MACLSGEEKHTTNSKPLLGPKFTSARIEATSKCNLRCSYCFASNTMRSQKGTDISTPELFRALDMFRRSDIKKLLYSGGEPFARRDFIDVLSASEGIRTSYVSNGSLVKDSHLEAIADMPHVNRIRYSIDGFAAHDAVRGGSSWKHVLGRVQATATIKRKRKVSVVGQATATFDSLDDVPELMHLLQAAGADRFRMFILRFSGEISNGKMALNSDYYDKYLRTVREIARLCQSGSITLQTEVDTGYQSDLERVLSLYEYPAFTDDTHPCQYLLHVLMIRSNGDIAICPFMQFPVGNIAEFDEVREIERHLPLVAWRNFRAVDISSCQNCRYLKVCRGGCRKTAVDTFGTFQSEDPVYCYLFPKIEREIWPEQPTAVQKHYASLINQAGSMPNWNRDKLDEFLESFRSRRAQGLVH